MTRVRELQLLQRLIHCVPAPGARRAGYPQTGSEHERLLHGEVAVESVVLPDKGCGVLRRFVGRAPPQASAQDLALHHKDGNVGEGRQVRN
jgi:hypothetical protein